MASLNVLALSDVMEAGVPRLAVNLRRDLMNASDDKSVISSRCKALEVAHVKKQFLCSGTFMFWFSGNFKSMC